MPPGRTQKLRLCRSTVGWHALCFMLLQMSKLLRGVAAGWGAKKLGGGCFTTILVFVILWYVLGHFQIFR